MGTVIEIKTKTEAVVVFPDRAQVTRVGTAQVEAGTYSLAANGLPATLLPASLRAQGRGTARAKLLSVDSERAFFTHAQSEQVAKLEAQLEELSDRDRELADREGTGQLVSGFLTQLADSAGKDLGKGLAFSRTSLADLRSFAVYLESSMADNGEQLRAVSARRREVEREIERVKRELEQLRAPKPTERTRATVGLEVLEAGNVELELTYVVPGASWSPLYDLRVTEGAADIEITYLGQVSQRTGEDWDDVRLALSTAKPAVSATLPEVTPWYVRPILPQAEMAPEGLQQARRARTAYALAEADMARPGLGAAPMVEEMQAATASVERSGAALTYAIRERTSLPADGASHKTTIGIAHLPCDGDYVTFPRLSPYAYRRVKGTNNTDMVLLSGQANIFWGGDYIGATRIEDIAPGQELEAFLGIDERVTIKRELAIRDVDKNLLGNRRRLQFGYRIKVQNLLQTTAVVEVLDQIPVARHEDIKVQFVRSSVPVTEQTDMGTLKWRLELATQEEQDIDFQFAIEYPRDMQVAGLPG